MVVDPPVDGDDDGVVDVHADADADALAAALAGATLDPELTHALVGALSNIVGFAQVLENMTDLDARAAWVLSRIGENAAEALARLRAATSDG